MDYFMSVSELVVNDVPAIWTPPPPILTPSPGPNPNITLPENSTWSHCPSMQKFGAGYKSVHGYTSLSVCVFGMIANALNIIVLTRKEMVTPTNTILTALAIADLLNMVEYVPFVVYMKFLPDPEDGGLRKTFAWATFVLFHSNFSQVCHTTAILLTLILAIWRYTMVTKPIQCRTLCSMTRARWAVASAYIIAPLLCIPIYCSFSVTAIPPKGPGTPTTPRVPTTTEIAEDLPLPTSEPATFQNVTKSLKYVVNLSHLAQSFKPLQQLNFWFFSIVIKLIPCLVLTVVSIRLVNSLLEARKRKELLFSGVATSPSTRSRNQRETVQNQGESTDPETGESSRSSSFTRSTGDMCANARTTRMLVAVLGLFLLTELPQGVLALMSGLLGEEFFTKCYMALSDLMDFMALLNSAINFILYCTMSRRFRTAFGETFKLSAVLAQVRQRRRLQGGNEREERF